MSMIMLSILDLDTQVFTFVNVAMANPFLDAVMPLWRNKYVWAPLYIFIIAFFLINFRKKGYWVILCLLLTVAFSDLMSSRIIKNTIQRPRPCNEISLENVVIERVHCGYGYSFTSSHATNHFAIALFLFMFLGPQKRILRGLLLFWAGSIAFGQVYVGVHYPLDVVAGSLLGSSIGIIGFVFYNRYFPRPMMV